MFNLTNRDIPIGHWTDVSKALVAWEHLSWSWSLCSPLYFSLCLPPPPVINRVFITLGAFLVAQLVKNPLKCKKPQVNFWVGMFPWRRDTLSTPVSWASLVTQMVKNSPAMQETWVHPCLGRSLGGEGMQPTLIFLPGESPWTEEPSRLQSMGSQRVRHNWSNSARMHSTGTTIQYSILTYMG